MYFISPSSEQRASLVANICLTPSEQEYHDHCVSFQVFSVHLLDHLLLRSPFDGSVEVCLSIFACFSIGRHISALAVPVNYPAIIYVVLFSFHIRLVLA